MLQLVLRPVRVNFRQLNVGSKMGNGRGVVLCSNRLKYRHILTILTKNEDKNTSSMLHSTNVTKILGVPGHLGPHVGYRWNCLDPGTNQITSYKFNISCKFKLQITSSNYKLQVQITSYKFKLQVTSSSYKLNYKLKLQVTS